MKRSIILSLIVAAVLAIPTYGVSPTDHSFLIGTWVNIDYLTTGSIPAFVIYEGQDRNLVINAFGQCTPTWCNWGVVPCIDYSDDPYDSTLATGFMAFYDFVWKETWVIGTRLDIPGSNFKLMQVLDFHFYLPPDPRIDWWNSDIFVRIN